MRVVLGVSGGIAAYKACGLLRRFAEQGHEVTVVPTGAALEFVGETTWAALSGRPVATDVWSAAHEVPHVRLGQQADLVVVAPATADLIAKAAHGLADDLLTNVLLTARCPVLLAPAMHTEMWTHPATQANVAVLRDRGVQVLEPASGRLTGADTGPGRLPEVDDIHAAALAALQNPAQQQPGDATLDQDLQGLRVLVTAGGTREPIDPVRFLGNRSSGKQGYAVAQVAAERGAEVRLVCAHTDLSDPPGVQVHRVETAREMQDAVQAHLSEADVVVMSAAVADYRPAQVAAAKMKKSHGPPGEQDPADAEHDGRAGEDVELTLRLVRNPDILAGLVDARGASPSPLIVGFAAETGDEEGDVLHHARAKLARKGCDLLVANEVGTDLTFGRDESTVHLLRPDTEQIRTVGPVTKHASAAALWDTVGEMLARS